MRARARPETASRLYWRVSLPAPRCCSAMAKSQNRSRASRRPITPPMTSVAIVVERATFA